jgi:YD repeat-containing protein
MSWHKGFAFNSTKHLQLVRSDRPIDQAEGRMLATLIASVGLASIAHASPPTAPTSLTASSASSTQINLTWIASSDNLSISSYVIERCQGSGCSNFVQVGTVSGGTTYTDSGLTPGVVYQYQVYATDTTGAGPNSNVANGSTFPGSVSGSTNYTYDALGRVVQASVPALGIVENYTYDAAGNLLSMTSQSTSTLAISSISSPEGAPGSTVTIVGSGFSTNPSSDIVTVNGVAATVVSATATELVIDIPAGATSGRIEVQAGNSAASSLGVFTVTAAVGAPTIASFLPAVTTTGSTVTLTGTGFQSALGDNQVLVNLTPATVTAVTPTSLTFVVPAFNGTPPDGGIFTSANFMAMAAPITITTPYGTATSAADLVISRTYFSTAPPVLTVDSAPVTISTPTGGASLLAAFGATAGQALTLVATSISTPGGVYVYVIEPNGVTEVQYVRVTVSGQGIQIPTPLTGTYSVYFETEGAGGSISWSVLTPLAGSLTLNGPPVTETVTTGGQATTLTFSGTQGENIALSLSSVTLSAATLTVEDPDGATLLSVPVTISGISVSPTLPATGTYTVLVTPAGSITGAFTAALASAQGSFSQTQSLNLSSTNPTTLTFTGSAGQYLTLSASQVSGTATTLSLSVISPSGTTLAARYPELCPTCGPYLYFNLGPLPESGTYSILAEQSASAANQFQLTLSTPVQGSTSIGAQPNVTLNVIGQGALETFNGIAGQYVSATLSTYVATVSSAGTIEILTPDGTVLGSSTMRACQATCYLSGVVSAGPLPTTGVYSVLYQQAAGSGPGSGALYLSLQEPMQGTLTVGSANGFTVLSGQGIDGIFTASAGQTLSIALQSTGSGAPTNGSISILDPTGVSIGSGTFAPCMFPCTGSGIVNVGPLQLSGSYTVLFQQGNGYGPGAGSVTVTPEAATSNVATLGSPSSVSVTSGQGFSENISGTAGQYVSVSLSSQGAVAPTDGTIELESPTGAVLASATYTGTCVDSSCSGAGNINLGPLPATGNYTLVYQQSVSNSTPGSGVITVTSESPVQGSLGIGSPTTSTVASGQGIQDSFNGTAGQYGIVTLSESASAIRGATIAIVAPSGATVASGAFYASCGTTCTGTQSLGFGPLPATGAYSVVVQQSAQSYGFGSGTLTLSLANTLASGGSSQHLTTSTAGQTAQFTFPIAAGQGVTLSFSNMVLTPSSVTSYAVTVTAPSGGTAGSASCSTATTCLVSLGAGVTQTGTYTVSVTPGGSATLSCTADIAPAVTGTLAPGSPLGLNLQYPGQAASLTFVASAGQSVAIVISEISATPTGTYYSVAVTSPTGTVGESSGTSSAAINLQNLAAGTYTVSVSTSNPATASMEVTLESGIVDALTPKGTSVNISTPAVGQAAYLTFAGTYGENLTLALSNLVLTPSSTNGAELGVTDPNGGGYYTACATTSCVLHLANLVQTANYTATLTPNSQSTITASASLTQDVTGTLSVGVPNNLTLGEVGQSATLTFTVPAELQQTFALNINSLSTNPSGTTYAVAIAEFNDRSAPLYSSSVSGDTTFNLPNLAPGTYVITVIPSVAATATMQVTLEPQSGGSLPVRSSGTGALLTTPAVGQNAYFTFAGTAGQNVSLAFTNIALVPSSVTSMTVTVTGPEPSYQQSVICYSTSSSNCELELETLPMTGTYNVSVTPGGAATMSFNVTLSNDASATLVKGTPHTVTLPAMGESAWLTFNATAGATFALYVSGITSTPANTSYTITVYNSAGTSVAGASTTSGTTFNLLGLPAGAYHVLIKPLTAATGSMQVTLEPQTGGKLSFTGSGNTYTTAAPGQDGYFTFSGTAGQDLGMALTGLTFTPSSGGPYALVYVDEPSGTQLTYGYCYPSNPGGGCQFSLTNLPTTGTYTVRIVPEGQQTMSFTFTTSQDVSGTLALNTPQNLTLVPGQNTWLKFTATAGQTVAVSASSIATTPSGQNVTLTILNSSGTAVGTAMSTSSATVNLPSLAAGTYSVLIVPSYGASATLQVTLASQTGSALSLNGATANYATTVPGQNAYFTFSGTAGEDLGIALTGLTFTPSSGETYATVAVDEPNGTQLAYTYCYNTNPGGGCQLSLTNLPTTGTYTVKIVPVGQQTMSFTFTASQDVGGTLALNMPQNLTLVPGQDTWLTFTATTGQTVAVSASSIVTTPSNQNVTVAVYNSSGTAVGSATGTSSATVNLPSLAAGTYSVLVVPSYGASATLQVTLASQTGSALSVNGSTANYATTVAGQNAYFTFSGTAGQDLGIALTGLTFTPSSGETYAMVVVDEPNGTQLAYTYCYTTNPGGGCELSLTNVPTTGTYTLRIVPEGQQTMSFGLTASQDVTATLTLNTPQNVSLPQTGQNAWLTFTIASEQTITVTTTGINAMPANTTYDIVVYSSSGSSVGSTSTTSGDTLTLSDLAAGTYNVLITPQYPATSSVQVSYQ